MEVLRPIKIFGCTQITVLVIVLNNLNQELSQILVNRCLKEDCFYRECQLYALFSRIPVRPHICLISPIILFSVISKLFDSIINKMFLDHLNRHSLLGPKSRLRFSWSFAYVIKV